MDCGHPSVLNAIVRKVIDGSSWKQRHGGIDAMVLS